MEAYVQQSKPAARTIAARTGHGQPDVATVLQAYRNRTTQLASISEEDQMLQGKFVAQLQDEDEEPLQGKFATQLQSDDEEETLQGKFLTQLQSAGEEEPLQQKTENRTGLPDQLKSGVESLSGYSLDTVKVHYNSPKPAQLQALAYTQGTDIHVGPGQEQYLGHEAWHVVQQMQGRVQPTTQLQGIAVNDNEGLEREADVMGERAVQGKDIIQRVSMVHNTTQQLSYPVPAPGVPGTFVNNDQVAGSTMNAYLDPLDPLCGSTPGNGTDYVLYKFLNKEECWGGGSFIKGHLLNANLGGPGLPENLFPITNGANKSHSQLVEEPLKALFVNLARMKGVFGTAAPTNADRLHYEVNAVWNSAVTNNFLNNPESQLNCQAEYVDATNNSLGVLLQETIVSDPQGTPADSYNDTLNGIGWGFMDSGKRSGVNRFTVTQDPVTPGLWQISGPQWDNVNNSLPGNKVHLTFV